MQLKGTKIVQIAGVNALHLAQLTDYINSQFVSLK